MIKKGIKIKLLVFLLLISMIPLSVLGYDRYVYTKELIQQREMNKIEEFHKNIEGKMIRFFGGGERDMLFLNKIAEDEFKADGIDHKEESLEHLTMVFFYFSKTNKQYDQIRFINEDGYEVIRINNKGGKPEIVKNKDLQYKGNRYYIKEAKKLKKEQMYISPIDLNREHGKIEKPMNPMMRLVMPIYHENTLKGFVALNLKINYLLKDIENGKKRSTYKNVMLINEDGFYIMHPDQEKEWGGKVDYNTGENFKKDYPNYLELYYATDLKMMEKKENILSWNPVKILKGRDKNLCVAVFVEKKDYNSPLSLFTKEWLLQMFVVLILVIIAGIYISDYLSRPIIKLTRAVEKIGKGNFDVDIDIDTKDEIESFAYEVKKMSFELKNMYHNMEILVKERTEKLENAHLKMKKMANTDSLTGLYNRHYFNQYIEKEEERIRKEKRTLVIFIIDVDKFKYINDFYGHNVGDEVLKEVAKILKASVKKGDTVVRYGGDEFLIVVSNTEQERGNHLMKRMNKHIKEWNENTKILQHELSLSVGAAEYNGEGSILEIIKIADERMYENKKAKSKERR
ncbi:MAG: diguanylate cyclase [Marinisporobacter sp.]|nr:diguanylate cyclase [Marinisporobacter sp.]